MKNIFDIWFLHSATKTVKFFFAFAVNCVICNNHTIIDWMLLNFTPVIQQNCHQPGRKFEKSFCAVDRLSCQLDPSKSETSQFRYRKLCACNLLTRGLNVVLRYLTSSDFCVTKIYGPVMCQNRPDVGNIIPINYQRWLRPDFFTFCNTCHVISLYWYFKNCQIKMYCECWNTQ